jgi:peptidoglycan/LPS O-acetylase OafA/YrhL
MLSGGFLSAPLDGVAVDVFFALSGYWIARLWDASYSTLPSPISTFYVSRAWRIFPLALVGSLVMVPLAGFPVGPETLLANAFLITLAGPHADVLDPPAWSLAIEVQFYLAAPLILGLARSARWTLILIALGAISWLLFAFMLIGASLPVFLLYFLAGVLYARGVIPQPTPRLVNIGLVLFLVFGVLANAFLPLMEKGPCLRLYLFALTMTVLPLAAKCVGRHSSERDRMLGDLAFPVYVIHWPMFALTSLMLTHWVLPAVIGTAAVSWLLWALVDRLSEQRRRQFIARRKCDDSVGAGAIDWTERAPQLAVHQRTQHAALPGRHLDYC